MEIKEPVKLYTDMKTVINKAILIVMTETNQVKSGAICKYGIMTLSLHFSFIGLRLKVLREGSEGQLVFMFA